MIIIPLSELRLHTHNKKCIFPITMRATPLGMGIVKVLMVLLLLPILLIGSVL